MNRPDYHGDNLYPQSLSVKFDHTTVQLDVPSGVWNPTPHGMHLGNMIDRLSFDGADVLELGSGCGNHTILIANKKPKSLTVTEIEQDILDNTRHNLIKNGVQMPVDYLVADWTHVDRDPFDVLITNPPFAKSGKRYFRYFIDSLINDAHKLVRPGGRLIFIQSSMANFEKSKALMTDWGMTVGEVGSHKGPFRDYYFEDPHFMEYIDSFPGAYEKKDGQFIETLTVFEAILP